MIFTLMLKAKVADFGKPPGRREAYYYGSAKILTILQVLWGQ